MLASQVLLPVPADALSSTASSAASTAAGEEEATGGEAAAPLLSFSVSDRMPKQCNGPHVRRELEERGVKWHGVHRHRRRIHQVVHDDHVDYLVHDAKTGSLQLSYPCGDCGLEDVHGTFANVARRELSSRKGSADGRKQHGHGVQLHFFQVDPVRPFSLVEHLQSLFQTHQSDRVAAATHLLSPPSPDHHRHAGVAAASAAPVTSLAFLAEATPKIAAASAPPTGAGAATAARTGRTVLRVEGICCSSEVPIVKSILEPLKGVSEVKVNPTTKLVYVTHATDLVASHQLANALTQEGFPSEIRSGAGGASPGNAASGSAFVRSLLALELPAATTTTTAADRSDAAATAVGGPDTEALARLLRGYDAAQMESFVVDVPARTVAVVHNPFALSAHAVAEAVQKETGIPTVVATDGADPKAWSYLQEWDASAEASGENLEVDEGRTYPRPIVILCGICWIISMLHYIGGNW
jgi:copper chaperone CopZ